MSVAEAFTKGIFDLLRALISIGGSILLFSILLRWMQGAFQRGKQWGQLSYFHPRRLWCKHRVSHYTSGAHGLWALWCADCGKKVNRK